MTPKILTLDIETRILSKTRPGQNGCIEWKPEHATQRGGYGVLNIGGRTIGAHRLACEALHGPAPADRPWALHRCNNPSCVNPFHLYWGDAADNSRDRQAAGNATGGRVRATHCVNGHCFTPENTYREPRGRACNECRREAVRRYRRRLREAG